MRVYINAYIRDINGRLITQHSSMIPKLDWKLIDKKIKQLKLMYELKSKISEIKIWEGDSKTPIMIYTQQEIYESSKFNSVKSTYNSIW